MSGDNNLTTAQKRKATMEAKAAAKAEEEAKAAAKAEEEAKAAAKAEEGSDIVAVSFKNNSVSGLDIVLGNGTSLSLPGHCENVTLEMKKGELATLTSNLADKPWIEISLAEDVAE